jgi:ubiquinone/menaquinone biosynthesis C-methylase UbiE
MKNGKESLDPEPLMQMGWSFAPSRVLATAVQLGLFSLIEAGHKTASTLVRETGASGRGLGSLLDALCALGLLSRSGESYALQPLSERFLVKKSPDYIGAMWEKDWLWEAWGGLTETVRTGQPRVRVEVEEEAGKFFPVLVRTLHVINRAPADRAARALGIGEGDPGLRILDVACGSGVWGIAIAQADRRARVTAQDFPALLAVTREYLERHGVQNQYDFLPGDLRRVDFGEEHYDLAILGNIVHSEGERASRELFGRLHRALRREGRLAIIDMIPNADRTGPPYPVLFALNMLVNTLEGGTYTLAEYERWLTGAGFARVETADIGSHSPMIVAHKS